MIFNHQRSLAGLLGLAFMALGLSASAQSNLLTNGSFELDANGKAFPNGASSSSWRWFAVGDTDGSATIRTAAASQGSVGLELVRGAAGTPGTADTAIDKYNDPEIVPAEPRIYQMLVDAKDGGVNASSNFVMMQLQFPAPAISPWIAFDPGSAFETQGILAKSGSAGEVSVRVASEQPDSSVLLDNVRLYDVTTTNRAINPGFENSATGIPNWRAFETVASTMVASISTDAHTGTNALRFERTANGGDAGVDDNNSRIPVFPGERLEYSLFAKKVAGDAAARLCVIVAEYDAAGAWTGVQAVNFFNAGAAYGQFTRQMTLGPNTESVVFAVRVGNDVGLVDYIGGYLIDDVVIKRAENLIDNGSFEEQTAGDTDGAIWNWRAPFTSAGTITVGAAAASAGLLGIELSHLTGTFWLDRWDTAVPPVTKPGVYKVLVDAKDGGVASGQDSFTLSAVMHGAPYPEYAANCVPGAAFETFGVTAPLGISRSGLDVRLTPSATDNQSFLADNVRVIDVTRGNRATNGGFENSTTRPVDWRSYSLNAGEFVTSIVADAHSGARALRLERTYAGDGDSDAGLDMYENRIATLPGETLEVSLWAKKVSGDADARLAVIVTEWDGAFSNVLLSTLALVPANPDSEYTRISIPVTMNATTTATLNVAFAVLDPATARHTGAYVIDDLQVVRNRVPSFSAAELAYGSDQSFLAATASGWNDLDGDVPQYLYQWKLNGTPIVGATRQKLTRAEIAGPGTITCDVTAWDGISQGNTIEATLPVSLATIIEAGKATALTIDGNAADWAALSSRVLPMSVYGQGGEDMLVNIQFAWNETNLYFLVSETQDDNQDEAANQDAFRAEPWMFDSISFWISFINGPTLLNSEFNPWFGFSSTGRTDLYSARLNNQATLDETAFTNAVVRTGGTAAAQNRVIEASVTWADLAGVLASQYQPYGGLVPAIGDGFKFGCEPLLLDNGFEGQSFRTGQTHVYPSGSDYDSIDVMLVPDGYSLNAAKHWSSFE